MANQLRPALPHCSLGTDQRDRVDLETGGRIVCDIGARPDFIDRPVASQQQAAAFKRMGACCMCKQLGVERA